MQLTLHPTPYTLHPTPYTLHPLHPTPYTLHPTHPSPYTLQPTPFTLHPTLYLGHDREVDVEELLEALHRQVRVLVRAQPLLISLISIQQTGLSVSAHAILKQGTDSPNSFELVSRGHRPLRSALTI